jgi:hypothetical protein
MKNGTLVTAMMLGALGSVLHHPAFAQSAVGGAPTRQNIVGGPVKHNSPVLPSNKGGSVSVSPPSRLSGLVKQTPVVAQNKTVAISVSPRSPLKCSAGACAAKGK